MTPEQYMRQALDLFRQDPPSSDFQRGYLEALKVFANEAMGFDWNDPLVWGEDRQEVETMTIQKPTLRVIDGGLSVPNGHRGGEG